MKVLSFCCQGLARLVGFTHAHRWFTEAPGSRLSGRRTQRGLHAEAAWSRCLWAGSQNGGEVRISIAGAVHPCLDTRHPVKAHRGTQDPSVRAMGSGGLCAGKAAVEWEDSVFAARVLSLWLDSCEPSGSSQRYPGPLARAVHFERSLR